MNMNRLGAEAGDLLQAGYSISGWIEHFETFPEGSPMPDGFFRFLIGGAGAGAFEMLKYWDLQHKLSPGKFAKLLSSYVFWIPVLGMMVASGFVSWAYFDGRPTAMTWDYLMAGVCARTLIREGSSRFVHKTGRLGEPDSSDELRLKDIFQ